MRAGSRGGRSARRLVLVVLLLTATVAGCAEPAEEDPFSGPKGRACQAVEYDAVQAALGVTFETAIAAQVEQTYSCALGMNRQPFPDLVATLTATTADHVIYRAIAVPSNFTRVEELGRFGYQIQLPAGTFTGNDGSPSGTALQIGWLSESPQMMTLRYTWPAGASDADVTALNPRLVDFARTIERSLVSHPAP